MAQKAFFATNINHIVSHVIGLKLLLFPLHLEFINKIQTFKNPYIMATKIEFKKPNRFKVFISDSLEFIFYMIVLFMALGFVSIIEKL